ncbi:MAG TPA: LutB/LldF family L-lactate oxidation iron-sulfur protein [Phycisphaerae bacterium]|nr:LutB/LldF family L-lactate oxidation iron-sulfur protein [Phycisphaerae bacterium]
MSGTAEKKIDTRFALPVFEKDFHAAAARSVADERLRGATSDACIKKDEGRQMRLSTELRDAEALRDLAARIKEHTIEHLPHYLELLAENVRRNGGVVHFAKTAADANATIVEIAKQNKCQLIVKSKSMASEETRLNDALEAAGLTPVETDLGELIVQLAQDRPSHLVMPIMHMRAKQVGEVFAKFFGVPFTEDPPELAEIARKYLREKFNQADMGISGCNFAIAETGSVVICTNEGNGRMCTSRPRIHVALMGMEKVIPRFADLAVFIKLLARAASGQAITQYTNIISGPRRADEHDGPEQFHLVIFDNGRSGIRDSEYRDVLRCIRCGACLNACPVFRTIGGHAYGSVYPGPIGSLLTPLFNGLHNHAHLPQASSLCGACFDACPVKINIPEMLIKMKRDMQALPRGGGGAKAGMPSFGEKVVFRLWTFALGGRRRYALAQWAQRRFLRHTVASKDGWISDLPGPAKGWTAHRDFPVPAEKTFRDLWKERRR